MLNWKNKQDGVDDVLAEDINNIANELIASQISILNDYYTKTEIDTLIGDIETWLGGI